MPNITANNSPTTQADLQTVRHNIIIQHKEKLESLRVEFTKKCDEITAAAKQKMAQTPESDQPARQQILADQQTAIKDLLSQLTGKISQLNQQLLNHLESLETALDQQKLGQLDQQINNL